MQHRLTFLLVTALIVLANTAFSQPDGESVAVDPPSPAVIAEVGPSHLLAGLAEQVGEADTSLPEQTALSPDTALPVLGGDVVPEAAAVVEPDVRAVLDRSGAVVATAHVTDGIVEVWELPDAEAAPAWQLTAPTEFGGPRHFGVIGRYGDWYRVQVPVRPNGTTGWIPVDAVTVREVDTRVEVDLSDRRIVVTDGGEVVFDEPVTIGAAGTPTPTGRFYLRDEFPWYPDSVYGPWVLALSAYSEAIDEINGGAAVVALHGTVRPDLMGTASSLGCVRLPNDLITRLAELVEVGTPVIISE
ncbi:MAG: L,D-transpeptidase family protein [Acidimicrobiales bacterium]